MTLRAPSHGALPRRDFLRGTATSALALTPFLRNVRAEVDASPDSLPRRFVFVVRGNGLRPYGIVPPALEECGGERYVAAELIDRPLGEVGLAPSMAALRPFADRLTIVQGLSSKICKGPHGGHFGVLGSYTSGDHAPPRKETLDLHLARRFPGIFRSLAFHIGTDPSELFRYLDISATGKNTRTPAYVSPALAYKDTFGTVLQGATAEIEATAHGNLLDFLVDDVRRTRRQLAAEEREKLDHYLHGFESLRERRTRLETMGDTLREHAPPFDDKYESPLETHRLEAHFDLTASALITGLTNVVTLRADTLDVRYQGFDHARMKEISLHDIGHTADVEGTTDRFESNWESGREMRRLIRTFQFEQIARLATRLDSVPEGNGTMLDHTVIVFLSDAGSQHHTDYHNMPVVVVGNLGGAFKTGRYLHYPGYAKPGHRTLANLWTAILHGAGQRETETYGDRDLGLPSSVDQIGPLAEWLV